MTDFKKNKRLKVWKKFNKRCAYCGCVLKYNEMQVDHVAPLFRGTTQEELDYWETPFGRIKGTNKLNNLNPSCKLCNSSKSTFTIEDWRSEILLKQMRLERDSSTFRLLKRFFLVEFNTNKVVFYFEKGSKNG